MADFWKTVRKVHLAPTEFFGDVDGEGFKESSKFVASIGLLLGGFMSFLGLLAAIAGKASLLSWILLSVFLIVFVPAILVVSAFFQSALVHIAVYVFGSRGFDKTYSAVAYPVSAVLLWGWIPVLNIIAGLYSIYLQAKGVEILHDMNFGKALICVVWPIILSLVLTFAFIAFAFLLGFGLALA